VRYRTAKRRTPRVFVIDVQRVVVAAQSGEVDDVGFGDRAPSAPPTVADLQIVKVERSAHVEELAGQNVGIDATESASLRAMSCAQAFHARPKMLSA